MRVVQLGFYRDPQRRSGTELLEAWPTLGLVAECTAAAGADVTVLQAADQDEEVSRDGVAYRFLGGGPRRLARIAAELRADAAHVHGLGFSREVRLLARRLNGTPILAQDRADRPARMWLRPLQRRALAAVAGVAFTAREQAEPFAAAGVLCTPTRIFEVPGGTSRFVPGDRAAARAATGLVGDPALLWVGRLDENKDPFTALDALRLASATLPDARLTCCFTDAPLLDAVRARLAAEPALAARVRLAGRVPHAEVELLCRAADFLVSASRRESTGFAVIEALACGTPVIATNIPAFRALMGDDRAGALVPVGDAAAMAGALVELAGRDPDLLRRAAREHFERELSPTALGRRLIEIYAALRRPT